MIYAVKTSTKESNYEQIVTLDGTDYILRFLWNERDAHWYLTVRDAAGDDLITGFKVVTDVPFAPHIVIDGVPPGFLWTLDRTGSETDPGLRDLGRRVRLVYVDEEGSA